VRGQLSATVQIAASEKNDSWKQGYLTTFAYDAAGNLERRTEYSKVISNWGDTVPVAPSDDALARATTYGYDAVNRRLRETILASQATGGVDLVTSYGYDSVGNQVSVTAADRTVTYTYYDQLGRVTATAKAHPDHTTKSFPTPSSSSTSTATSCCASITRKA
jgi:YD repeat-containing protein